MNKITKAVFPVAGLGTRFLPATKANPKEMLPIVDKPLIQYAVEEAVKAGITELVFVTSSSKRAIEDHFDKNFELEQCLLAQGKNATLEMVRNIVPKGVDCIYVRQPQALGLGHAVLCAKKVIGNHPFALLLADDLIDAPRDSCLEQMLGIYHENQASVIAVQKIDLQDSENYGMVAFEEKGCDTGKITAIVEKPKPQDAPSPFAVIGRYILTAEIFSHLELLLPGQNSEIQLTDAIASLLLQQKVMALPFHGVRYDCGSKLGYLKATIAYGLKHVDIGESFREYLRTQVLPAL